MNQKNDYKYLQKKKEQNIQNYCHQLLNVYTYSHRKRNNIREHKDDDEEATKKKKHKLYRFLSFYCCICLNILSVHFKMQEINLYLE